MFVIFLFHSLLGLYEADGKHGKVTCGGSYWLLPQMLLLVVTTVFWKAPSFFATGVMLENGDFDRSVTVSAPVDRLKPNTEKLPSRVRKEMVRMAQEQYRQFKELLKGNSEVRRLERRCMVTGLLRSEMKAVFSSKNLRRTFMLGLYSHEFDLDLFGVDPFTCRRVTYSYRNGNICFFDGLLGERWDVHGQKFITQVIFFLNKGLLVGNISAAFSPNAIPPVSSVYREELHTFLTERVAA